MDVLHKIDEQTHTASPTLTSPGSRGRVRTYLPRIFTKLTTVTPAARLVAAGRAIGVERIEIASQLKSTLSRSFQYAEECYQFRVRTVGGVLEFYCLD